MKKKTLTNVLVKAIVILLIVLVSVISFLGIYKRNLNGWENIIPEFNFSKELSEERTFSFIVDTSTKTAEHEHSEDETEEDHAELQVSVNDPSSLTTDNYKKSRDIIEKRLKNFGIVDATVTVDEKTGKIDIEAPFSKAADYISTIASSKGNVEIIDTESKEVLINKNMIKKASSYYRPTDTATEETPTYDLGVKLEFTSEGQKKLNEISKQYIETTDENGEKKQKTITVQIGGEDKYVTYFSTEGTYTYIAMPLYQGVNSKETETFNKYYNECIATQAMLNEETMPVKYTVSTGTYIESNLSDEFILGITIAGIVILVIIGLVMIKKYGKNGIMAIIIEVGYVAILFLLLRVASVNITLTGIVAILLMTALNYLLLMMLMNKGKFVEFGKFILNMIPFIITIIVFNFAKNIDILSIGMIGFWGLITFIYTLIVSTICLDTTNKNGVE